MTDPKNITEETTLGELAVQRALLGVTAMTIFADGVSVLHATGVYIGQGATEAQAIEDAFVKLRRVLLPEPLKAFARALGGISPTVEQLLVDQAARLETSLFGLGSQGEPTPCACSSKYLELAPGVHANYCPLAGQALDDGRQRYHCGFCELTFRAAVGEVTPIDRCLRCDHPTTEVPR